MSIIEYLIFYYQIKKTASLTEYITDKLELQQYFQLRELNERLLMELSNESNISLKIKL
jgi:hypothetical protein